MENDYVKVSRRQVRRILDLYTLQGCTQQQIGEIIFSPSIERKIDRGVLVRRVLHQLGLNMQSRGNYASMGLTPRMIDSILDNPFLIFPLVVPIQGELLAFINFDLDFYDQLDGTGRASKTRGWVLNALALVIIAALQFLATKYADSLVVLLLFCGVFVVAKIFTTIDNGYHAHGQVRRH